MAEFKPTFDQLCADLEAARSEGANLVPISVAIPQGNFLLFKQVA